MKDSFQLESELKDFSGQAPLFPLPNVVLFPHALLPLQIFEPRYRQMTADVLEGERLIAMGLMSPGWERLPASAAPPVHPVMGLGKIIAHEKLDDGRYYLVLRGVARVHLISERVADLPYRVGQFEICTENATQPPTPDLLDRTEDLVLQFIQLFPQVKLHQLVAQGVADLPLATVCDVLLGSLPMASELSQRFLNELNADVRSQMLLELLRAGADRSTNALHRTFPPDFSPN